MHQALNHAKLGVELADQSKDDFQRLFQRTTLANTQHHTGCLADTETLFQRAEEIQKHTYPEFPILHSVQGFRYCLFLLDRRRFREVRTRSTRTLEWAVKQEQPLEIALDRISLGRACLRHAQKKNTCNFALVSTYLHQSVDGLRKSGRIDYLPHGLLARAELYRAMKDFKRAYTDLAEAQSIAERGEMMLFVCDIHLEWTRLRLAQGDRDKAREHWATAKAMIERMGYHRRDRDVEEIEKQLA
jgi:tetratricopeptide (TPR) repeat protein